MEKKIITFIIPAYNCEKYIRNCIKNLVNQDINSYEIIIINDGSTDETGEICDYLASKNKKIKVIHKKNEGQGIARNLGIKEAKGEYIAFIDADDMPNIKSYGKAIQIAKKANSDWIICDWSEFNDDNDTAVIHKDMYNIEKYKKLEIECILKNMALGKKRIQSAVWNKIFKADIIKDHKIYFQSERTVISEDFLFNCEYSYYSKMPIWIDEVLYNYRQNNNSFCHRYQNNYTERLKML